MLPRNIFFPIEASVFSGRRLLIAGCACGVVALAVTVSSAQISIGSGLRADRPSSSIKDLRDQNVVKQRSDFSCGAAALATLLRYGFGEHVTEREILVQLFDLLSEEEKKATRTTGFSLLHLQRVAQARGYNAEGFRLDPDQLAKLGGPVIVFIEPRGYKHFAVLRGAQGDRVYLADPSRGNIRMPGYSFLKDWQQGDNKGIIFVVEPKAGLPGGKMPLTLTKKGLSQPEIMSARELLAVRSSLVRLSELSR
jgi:predicted double-glycine peptidase